MIDETFQIMYSFRINIKNILTTIYSSWVNVQNIYKTYRYPWNSEAQHHGPIRHS